MAEEERPAESSDSCKNVDNNQGDQKAPASACKLDDDEGSQQSMKLVLEDSVSPGDAAKEEDTAVAKPEPELAQAPKEKEVQEEVGVVGQPEAASELLQEDELAEPAVNNLGDSAKEGPTLPTDGIDCVDGAQQPMQAPDVSERVARWVENAAVSTRANSAGSPSLDEDETLKVERRPKRISGRNDASVEPEEIGTKTRSSTSRRSSAGSRESNGGSEAGRGSQKVVTNIIRRSIRCLNKMHAMDSSSGVSVGNGKKIDGETMKRDDDESRKSPKVPQSQQNGAALPEETASADRNLARCGGPGSPIKRDKKEPLDDNEGECDGEHRSQSRSSKLLPEQTSRQNRTNSQQLRSSTSKLTQQQQSEDELPVREIRKRRLVPEATVPSLGVSPSNGSPSQPKRLRIDQREQFINSLIGPSDKLSIDQLAMRSDQLRAEVQELDELARAKEMEWNEILSMRKLKEEAYLRLERRRQVMGFMESNGPQSSGTSSEHQMLLPPASLVLPHLSFDRDHALPLLQPKEERTDGDNSSTSRRDLRHSKNQHLSPYQLQQQLLASAARYQQLENGPRLQQQLQGHGGISEAQSLEHRQIGEGRQGPIVDVRSIIADYRLRHPEAVPKRRGRRMRNSVNVGLGAGGAMVETGNTDSRPSSTDSCKSNSNIGDPTNPMSFKDVLVQFAKLSQQQGEPIKTPQNYPDVTLHPVTAAQTTPTTTPQATGSLLHGILTKSQSPRPTTFSPTLARLLTAPERERSASALSTASHHSASQHILQAYQNPNPVSITDFLSSSKARTEITITPVVNNPIQSLSNNLIQVDDGDEDSSIIEERDSRVSIGTRDNRDERDSQPRCQGCHERLAQFVCAGCGNQWYCSRECQVAAWDDHSEVCSG